MLDPSQTINIIKRAQRDPVWWVREFLGEEPWGKQREILESLVDNPVTAVRSCHGIGKSWVASRAVLWFLFSYPGSIVFTTAPTKRQVESIIWQEVGAAYAKAKWPLGGDLLKTRLDVGEKWFAFGFTTRVPDGFQGLHAPYILGIVDEASGLAAAIWDAIDGNLSAGHTRLLSIGNPTDPAGKFAAQFKTPGVKKIFVSAFDTPNFTMPGIALDDIRSGAWEKKLATWARVQKLDPGKKAQFLAAPHLVDPFWVADKYRKWGEASPTFVSRVLGNFPDAGDDIVVPLHLVEAAQYKWENYERPKSPTVNRISVDVARFGSNETVVGHRLEHMFKVIKAQTGLSIPAGAGEAVRAQVTCGAKSIIVDGDGLGGGTIDILREQNRPVIEFRGGGKPANDDEKDDKGNPLRTYLNARAEAYWTLREAYMRGEVVIDPKDEDLAAQVSSIRYKFTSTGLIQIESKDEMQKRGLPSPDRADTQAMAWAPLNKQVSDFIKAMQNARA